MFSLLHSSCYGKLIIYKLIQTEIIQTETLFQGFIILSCLVVVMETGT